IREAMRSGGLMPPMGGNGNPVEADETFIGRLEGQKKRKSAWAHKNIVLTLVERGGSARSFHVDGVMHADLGPILRANLSREAQLMTDKAAGYKIVGREFASHDSVDHSKEASNTGGRARLCCSDRTTLEILMTAPDQPTIDPDNVPETLCV